MARPNPQDWLVPRVDRMIQSLHDTACLSLGMKHELYVYYYEDPEELRLLLQEAYLKTLEVMRILNAAKAEVTRRDREVT